LDGNLAQPLFFLSRFWLKYPGNQNQFGLSFDQSQGSILYLFYRASCYEYRLGLVYLL
jgi:hypothetical protein